ncbi:unnamed protein product [Prunus armeniaca]
MVDEDVDLRSKPGMGVMPGSPQGSSRVPGNSGRVLSQYLVHLGNHDFFYVQTGKCDSHPKVQYLSITTFEIVLEEGKHMIKTIDSIVHSVDIKGSEWFDLVFCFTS